MSEQDYIKELLNKITAQCDETQDSIVKIDKKLDLHIQKTELEFKHIRELDENQNKLLEEHAIRSDRLEKDNLLREQQLKANFEDRFREIEKPREFIKTFAKMFLWMATAAGAIYGAWEFFNAFVLK